MARDNNERRKNMINLNTDFEAVSDTTKDFCVEFNTTTGYEGSLFYSTREEAQEMFNTMYDQSIVTAQIVYMPERKVVDDYRNALSY